MKKVMRSITEKADNDFNGSNHYWLEMENFGDIEAIDVRFIEMADEVKAIPIEFIERKLAEHWYVDYDVRELLADWEKENETDR